MCDTLIKIKIIHNQLTNNIINTKQISKSWQWFKSNHKELTKISNNKTEKIKYY